MFSQNASISSRFSQWKRSPCRVKIDEHLGFVGGIDTVIAEGVVNGGMIPKVMWLLPQSLKGADPVVFLSLGIAAAIVVGGRVVAGAHGASGEIGYSVRSVLDHSGAAHDLAPLEEAVGGRFIGGTGLSSAGGAARRCSLFGGDDALEQSRPGFSPYHPELLVI